MPTPPYCPQCFVKLEPEMRACPNCPMSFPDDDDAPAKSGNPLKQSRYYQFLMPALFFAALGMTVWWLASGMFRLGEDNANTPQLKVTNERPPEPESSYPPAPKDEGKAPSDQGAGTVSIQPVEDAPPPPAVAPITMPEAPPKKVKAVKEWRFRGTVYDLTTLKPLAGVQLNFTDPDTNANIRTRSNSQGVYRVIVPSLPDRGYSLTAAKNGYSPNYLDPGTPGVRQMAASERREMAKGLSDTLTASPASIQGIGAAPLITDLFLAPRP
jgi:hypothetical protein